MKKSDLELAKHHPELAVHLGLVCGHGVHTVPGIQDH